MPSLLSQRGNFDPSVCLHDSCSRPKLNGLCKSAKGGGGGQCCFPIKSEAEEATEPIQHMCKKVLWNTCCFTFCCVIYHAFFLFEGETIICFFSITFFFPVGKPHYTRQSTFTYFKTCLEADSKDKSVCLPTPFTLFDMIMMAHVHFAMNICTNIFHFPQLWKHFFFHAVNSLFFCFPPEKVCIFEAFTPDFLKLY